MDLKNLSDDDKVKLEEESKRQEAEFKKAITLVKPEDMDTEKILSRAAMLGVMCGSSRTTVLGAATLIALRGPYCGLSKDQAIAIIEAGYQVAETNPYRDDIVNFYTEENTKYHVKKATESQDLSELEAALSGLLGVSKDVKVH